MIPALIPIVTAILPSAIRAAEGLFRKETPNAPPTGPVKKTFVMDLIESNLDVLDRHGKLPKEITENRALVNTMLSLMIDVAVSLMKDKPVTIAGPVA